MIDDGLIFLVCSIFVPLLIFIFKPQWKFFATTLSCANLCFWSINDMALIANDNLWGLLQTEVEVSKSVFFVYQSALICLFVVLLCVAYKYVKMRTIIFMYFVLCNILGPFYIVEKFLWGKY